MARAFKTRSQATRACTLGRVRVNGNLAKPHRRVEVEDSIEIQMKDGWKRILRVLELRDKTVSKELARTLFEDQSPPRPKRDAIDQILKAGPGRRERGSGRPTKRDRRNLDRLRS